MRSFHLILIGLFLGTQCLLGQVLRDSKDSFVLKGVVVEAGSGKPVSQVNVEIRGGSYTSTNRAGEFAISASIGDELVIRNEEFETVYYTIRDEQQLTLKVRSIQTAGREAMEVPSRQSPDLFRQLLDSARAVIGQDAAQSIEFVTRALESAPPSAITASQNSQAYEVLGDINRKWLQPDLAIDNYKRSLEFRSRTDVRLKLAVAYRENGNYQEGIGLLEAMLEDQLSQNQRMQVFEALGDIHAATGEFARAETNYQNALEVANSAGFSARLTDLNSKLGEVLAQSGAVEEAETYFGNSLNLARKENAKRAVVAQDKVADFYNRNQLYDKEISIRSELLEELEDIDSEDAKGKVGESVSPQRQNFKIGDAYLQQQQPEEAIRYLEESIREADAMEDLDVARDATRKLSLIYKEKGDFTRAAQNYERYVEIVDELYKRKERELEEAARLSREIALKQSRIASLENERRLNESRFRLAYENQQLSEKNLRTQRWIIGSLSLVALLLLLLAYVQYRNMRQQKYANNLLALKSLRTQMNPHFIFNALNSVNSFIASNDERAANRYLSEFSALMRAVLENSEKDFIPLSREIEMLRLYIKLEHFRFSDTFDYDFEVDPAIPLEEFVIPPMLLQPYVENAVWHGLRYMEGKGQLKVRFELADPQYVRIEVLDNGIGRKRSRELKTQHQKRQKSRAMGNIKQRIDILNRMYSTRISVKVADVTPQSGTQVTIMLEKYQ